MWLATSLTFKSNFLIIKCTENHQNWLIFDRSIQKMRHGCSMCAVSQKHRHTHTHTHTHTHPFNGPFSGTTRVSRYQKGTTNLDFTEARDSEWQWHQLGHMQVCTSLQTDNHASTPPLSFLQAECPSCRPTNSIKALKDKHIKIVNRKKKAVQQ